MILSELLNKYVEEKALYNSVGTIRFYKDHIPFLLSYFKSVEVESISKQDVINFIKFQQSNDISNNTINHRIGILKASCRYYGYKNFEFYNLKRLPVVFRTCGFLDSSKQLTIFNILMDLSLPMRTIILLFLDTGVRLTELLNIKVENVDFVNRHIFLTITKTKKSRYVYFTVNTGKILKKYLGKDDRKYLFVTRQGKQMKVSGIESAFSRIRKKYGIKRLSPHMLRHTLATNLYNSKADLIFIESIMGHANTETTKRYIHTDVDSNQKRYDMWKKDTFLQKK